MLWTENVSALFTTKILHLPDFYVGKFQWSKVFYSQMLHNNGYDFSTFKITSKKTDLQILLTFFNSLAMRCGSVRFL